MEKNELKTMPPNPRPNNKEHLRRAELELSITKGFFNRRVVKEKIKFLKGLIAEQDKNDLLDKMMEDTK